MATRHRLLIEYTLLLCIVVLGVTLGSFHPLIGAQNAQPVQHQFSLTWIFSGNVAIIAAMLLCSVFTGGIVGCIVLFVNTFIYGSVIAIYNQSPWLAIFPWLEIVSLLIAIQIGADLFWALLLKWRIQLKLTLILAMISIFLLAGAAFIEGGILNV